MPVRSDFAPGEFCWVDLSPSDLASAAAWYSEIFGWSHQLMEPPGGAPPHAFFVKGEAVVGGLGALSEERKAHGVPPMWNDYVATADRAATEAKVKELGGTVTVPTMEVPGHGKLAFPTTEIPVGWFSVLSDSQGAVFGVIQMKARA